MSARRTAFRSRGWPRRRRRCRSRSATRQAQARLRTRLEPEPDAELVITIFVHRNGKTEQVTSIDRAWLDPALGRRPLGRSRRAVHSRVADPHRHVRVPPALGRGRAGAAAVSRRSKPYDGYLYVDPARHRLPTPSEHGLRDARRRLLPRRRTISSPCTTATRARSPTLRDHCRAQHEDPGRGAGRAVPPHRRRDGRPLPARGREARGRGSTSSRTRCSSSPSRTLVREILDEKRDVVVAAARS